MRSRRVLAVAALTVLALAALVGRAAAAVDMGGHPVHVYAAQGTDSTGPGGLQARFDGFSDGQFVPPGANATPAGLHIGVLSPGPVTLFGPTGSGAPASTHYNIVSGPTQSGSGSGADPLKLDTTYSLPGTGLSVAEQLSYVNGQNVFRASYKVTNGGGGSTTFRPTLAANLFISGGNTGYGVFEPGPPRLVSGINDVIGDGGAIQDSDPTPFAHYQEDDISAIWGAVGNPSGSGFNDSVNPALVNPGVGVQWPDTTLGSGNSATFAASVFVGGFNGMTLSPLGSTAVPGTQKTITATVLNHGQPAPGVHVPFTVTGANPHSGIAISDGAGHAQITWTGNDVGLDTLNAYPDSNGNGVRDAGEILRIANVLWALPKPKFGKTANLTPVSGSVTITPPGGGTLTVTKPRQIPINSFVNVTTGVVKLVTARTGRGGEQAGTFFGGKFKLIQKKSRRRHHKATADLKLVGGKSVSCATRGKKAEESRRRRRRHLWGSARGRYRTVGTNSAATIRGTRWLVSDTCAGTLTLVRKGKVVVTDFVRHKTVIVKKGHRYLARFK